MHMCMYMYMCIFKYVYMFEAGAFVNLCIDSLKCNMYMQMYI